LREVRKLVRFKHQKKYIKTVKVTKPSLHVRVGRTVESIKAGFQKGVKQYQRESQKLAKYGDRIIQSVSPAVAPPKRPVETPLTEAGKIAERPGLGLSQMSKEADSFVKEIAGFRRKKKYIKEVR